jgi:hypothetical protein
VRNAIGVPATRQGVAAGNNAHVGPAPQRLAAPSSGIGAVAISTGARLAPDPRPSVAGISSHARIDMSGPIRPAVTLTGLGGPAKAIAGINGTTFRPKR